LSVEVLEDRCLLSLALGPATVPAPFPTQGWLVQAVTLDLIPKHNPQIVFLGDSIVANYAFSPAWMTKIAPLGALDLAIGGSTTQNVLWQLDLGLLKGTAPRVIVLLVGTNNLAAGDTPQETADGVAAIVTNLRKSQPQARILLLGILPRGESTDDPLRPLIVQTNEHLAKLANGMAGMVRFLDVGAAFLQSDGSISPDLLSDFLHPSQESGYSVLTANIEQTLDGMLFGVGSASIAVGPFGVVLEIVDQNGTLTQYDKFGAHRLFSGVAAAQVSFGASGASGASGEVLDVFFTNGLALQFDAHGVHLLS
jgi:lysophospholipase L1-like esterase